MAKCFTLYFER